MDIWLVLHAIWVVSFMLSMARPTMYTYCLRCLLRFLWHN